MDGGFSIGLAAPALIPAPGSPVAGSEIGFQEALSRSVAAVALLPLAPPTVAGQALPSPVPAFAAPIPALPAVTDSVALAEAVPITSTAMPTLAASVAAEVIPPLPGQDLPAPATAQAAPKPPPAAISSGPMIPLATRPTAEAPEPMIMDPLETPDPLLTLASAEASPAKITPGTVQPEAPPAGLAAASASLWPEVEAVLVLITAASPAPLEPDQALPDVPRADEVAAEPSPEAVAMPIGAVLSAPFAPVIAPPAAPPTVNLPQSASPPPVVAPSAPPGPAPAVAAAPRSASAEQAVAETLPHALRQAGPVPGAKTSATAHPAMEVEPTASPPIEPSPDALMPVLHDAKPTDIAPVPTELKPPEPRLAAPPPAASGPPGMAWGFEPVPARLVEAPTPPASPAPLPMRQVAPIAIALAFTPGVANGFQLNLDPVELGRVEIRVQREGEAHSVRIVAERPETLALLLRDRQELDRGLADAGLRVDAKGIDFSLSPPAGQADQRQQGEARPGPARRPTSRVTGQPEAEAPPSRALRGLLDLNI